MQIFSLSSTPMCTRPTRTQEVVFQDYGVVSLTWQSITFALCNFCIHLHQEKRLRALVGSKLKQVLALELLEQRDVQGWGWLGKENFSTQAVSSWSPCPFGAGGDILGKVGWGKQVPTVPGDIWDGADLLRTGRWEEGSQLSQQQAGSGASFRASWHCDLASFVSQDVSCDLWNGWSCLQRIRGSKKKESPSISVVVVGLGQAVHALSLHSVLYFGEMTYVWLLPLSESGVGKGH